MNVRLLTIAIAFAGVVCLAAKPADAQHFDVFVGRPTVGTQTAYGGIDVDTAEITLGLRVFESEMSEDPFDGIFISDEPGFNSPEEDSVLSAGAASLISGDEIFVSALPLTVDGMTDSLFYWNGLGSVAFAPADGVTLTIETGNSTGSIGTAGVGGGFDDHPFFVLDDGDLDSMTSPTPGIYLAAFQGRVADLDPTDPLFLVMGTEGLITADFLGITQVEFEGLSEEELDEELEGVIELGVEFVERNVVVPEPSSLLLTLVCCGVGVLVSRQRATC